MPELSEESRRKHRQMWQNRILEAYFKEAEMAFAYLYAETPEGYVFESHIMDTALVEYEQEIMTRLGQILMMRLPPGEELTLSFEGYGSVVVCRDKGPDTRVFNDDGFSFHRGEPH